MNKVLVLAGRKSLLKKVEHIAMDNLLGLLSNKETIREIIEGKVIYRIPVLELNLEGNVLKGVFVKELVSLKEKKLSKYSIIRPKSYTIINNYYVLNRELSRIEKIKPVFKLAEEVKGNIVLDIIPLEVSRKPEVIIEINKGSNYKREVVEYKIGDTRVLVTELDRIQPTTYKFPFSYGSIVGLPSLDGDFADCFIISKTNKIKEGKRFYLKRKKEEVKTEKGDKVIIRTLIVNRKIPYKLVAILETKDQSGEDPKFIFSDGYESTEKVIETINTCYSKWKRKAYSCTNIITDIKACEIYINKLRK